MRLIAWFAFTSLAAAVLLASCVTPQSEVQNALVLPSEVVSSQAKSNGYAGPQACAQCHSKNYNDYRASGHPKKLRPAAEARAFGVQLPPGWEWKDISYVIGGARWKARYVDLQGYIVTSTGMTKSEAGKNQYNLATGRFVDYNAGKKLPYDCGSCHTTGYSKEGHQDGLPGIVGSWAFSGITCEACHGPGAAHSAGPSKTNIKVDMSPGACGQCHIRGAKDTIPADRGFIQHHEQYNEYLAGAHVGTLECVSCHDPHKRAAISQKLPCSSCHADAERTYSGSAMQRAGVACIDCHMPRAGRSAEIFSRYEGDVRTHIFKISLGANDRMFSADGKFATGKLTADFACLGCHGSRDLNWARTTAKGIHGLGKR
jgi:Cytochrome c3